MRSIITIILVLAIGFFIGSYFSKNGTNPITNARVKSVYDKLSTMSVKDTMDYLSGDLAGKAGAEFDREYLKAMIVAHQTEIAMAGLASITSPHTEIKEAAKETIAKQTAELNQLKAWQKEWFPDTK